MRTPILAFALLSAAASVPAQAQEEVFRVEREPITNLSDETVQGLEDRLNRTIESLHGLVLPEVRFTDPQRGIRDTANLTDWDPEILAIMWGARMSDATIDIGRPRGLSALPRLLQNNRFAPLAASASGNVSIYEAVLLYALLVRTWRINHRMVGHLLPSVLTAIDNAKTGRLGGSALRCLNRIELAAKEVGSKAQIGPPQRSLGLPLRTFLPCRTAR